MRVYTVGYRLYMADQARLIDVLAKSKADAYDKAVYEAIPEAEDGQIPYSAWVQSVIYQSGKWHDFEVYEGMSY